MPPKSLAKAGLIALAVALLLPWGYTYWLKTRTFEPLNKPVLLEAGKVLTENFEINLREDYNVQIDMDLNGDYYWIDERTCPFRFWEAADWKVYRLSGRANRMRELWASSAEIVKQGGFPTGFRGGPGKYQMEWTLSASQACMNGRHALLRVYTSWWGYEDFRGFLIFACAFPAGTGILLILRAIGAAVFGRSIDKPPPRMFPEMELRNVIPRKRRDPMPLIKEAPNFGLVYGGILWILILIHMMLQPVTRMGIWVDFRGQKALGLEKSPWTETVSVYVDGRRGFLVNGHPVRGEELQAELKKELSRQMVWMVYLEADPDCKFMDVVHAMDTIQGLGAKLVWITPKTREGWKQTNTP